MESLWLRHHQSTCRKRPRPSLNRTPESKLHDVRILTPRALKLHLTMTQESQSTKARTHIQQRIPRQGPIDPRFQPICCFSKIKKRKAETGQKPPDMLLELFGNLPLLRKGCREPKVKKNLEPLRDPWMKDWMSDRPDILFQLSGLPVGPREGVEEPSLLGTRTS